MTLYTWMSWEMIVVSHVLFHLTALEVGSRKSIVHTETPDLMSHNAAETTTSTLKPVRHKCSFTLFLWVLG